MNRNNYYDLKQIKPNKVMKFKLLPRASGKFHVRQKRGKK